MKKQMIAAGAIALALAMAAAQPPFGSPHVLTSGGKFAGKTIELAACPDWLKSISVNAAGDIEIETKRGFCFRIW